MNDSEQAPQANVPVKLKRIQVIDHCLNTATDKDHAADLVRTIESWHERRIRLETIIVQAWREVPGFQHFMEEEYPDQADALERVGA